MAKKRDLLVLTRKEGVRKENPLLTYPKDYYPPSNVRTPEIRKEADDLTPEFNRGALMPNKIKSAKQYRFMQAAAHGGLKSAVGPSPEVAKEIIHGESSEKRKKFAKVNK
jgi:hypothetical protein